VDVIAVDDDNTSATDYDTETVTFDDVLPDISVMKTASPTSVPETGGNVTFTFRVTNAGVEDVTITSLEDNKFGDLAGDADCYVGAILAAGASCSFEATFTIPAGDVPGSHVNTFTAVGADDDGNTDTADWTETVTYSDVAPLVDLTKTADPLTLPEPGGVFTFTLSIHNTSDELVTITALT